MASWLEGLNVVEVEKQRQKYGANVVARNNQIKAIKIFLSQFMSPLVYVLLFAAVITYLLGEKIDASVILVAVVFNSVLGFVQEFKAEKSLLALTSLLTPVVKVHRNGERMDVSLDDIVVGDIVFLSDEHRVPADGVLVEEDGIFADESLLTGESELVEKYDYSVLNSFREVSFELVVEKMRNDFESIDDKYKALMGTRIDSGVGKMLVVRVGKETQMGKIAEGLKKEIRQDTPLQKQVQRLSKQLAIFVGIVSLVVLIVGLTVGDSFREIFPVAVALAVAAIPEGLVVSMTVILALGMQRILKKKAIVRSLAATETLGSVDVVCADKTGTLTEGIMKVTRAVTSLKEKNDMKDEIEVARAAICCNDLRDPLEIAMDKWARENFSEKKLSICPRVDSIPFTHKNQLIASLHEDGVVYVSGAPEVILKRCGDLKNSREDWENKFKEYANKGFRLVGFAYKKQKGAKIKLEDVKYLKWLGFLVYEDPVRLSVKGTIQEIVRSGIAVKVITGDYKETAIAILRQIGLLTDDLDGKVVTGDELEQLSDEELLARIDKMVLFARTKPQQKLRIVEALKKNGHIVAMTGDGVNDALALKQADIGVVVNSASDVAKETSDMVLLDSNLETIVKVIREGRGIFDNLRKVTVYLLADAFSGILVVIGSLLLGWPLPMLAVQILWINLISDGFPSMALTIEPYDEAILEDKDNRNKRLLNSESWWVIGVVSILLAALTLVLFGLYLFKFGEGVEKARTLAFAMTGSGSLAYVFSTRSFREPIWELKINRNLWLIWGVLGGVLLLLMAIYVPFLSAMFKTRELNIQDWGYVGIGCILLLVLVEIVKLIYRNRD